MPAQADSIPRRHDGRPRDLRLDFFRGLAMFIILLAHTPGNTWTLWIPARFGFSDATEIFVFCSGMASAIAFGAVFVSRSWWLGSARIAYRVWQVYWAHIGMMLAVMALLYAIDANGWGDPSKTYIGTVPVVPFFENTGAALVGMLTLTWVPNYFDILPMYLVILAMVPALMLAHKAGGRPAAAAAVLGVWFAAQFGWLDLPARPWIEDSTWFFNPFGWQIVFFTGFAFGIGWLPAPPVNRALLWTAAGIVLLTIPFAWFKIHKGVYLPEDWALRLWIAETRADLPFIHWKTWMGIGRYIHFLAIAYLAWAAVGPGGVRLSQGWNPPPALSGWKLNAAAAALILTIPYAYAWEIRTALPALDAAILAVYGDAPRAVLGFDLLVPSEQLGMLQLVHLAALVAVAWSAIGDRARAWLAHDLWLALVPVIRKVGTQSLAVFLVSMVMARASGVALDVVGRDVWTTGAVNLAGFGVLIATAYFVGWFRAQPWRRPAPAPSRAPAPPPRAAPSQRPDPATIAGTPAE